MDKMLKHLKSLSSKDIRDLEKRVESSCDTEKQLALQLICGKCSREFLEFNTPQEIPICKECTKEKL